MRKQSKISVLFISLLMTGAALADEQKIKPENCERMLVVGQSQIIPSGRDPKQLDEFEKAKDIILGPNGIAKKLGLILPPHSMTFAPSAQLATLAILGRHAVGHWYDGSVISTQAGGVAGVLEFVTPGCPTCRSFYRDNTSFNDQLSIIMHVAGHNDFSSNSVLWKVRSSADQMADSLKLYELMEDLYKKEDHNEVSQWYQFLLTIANMHDFARGTFDAPETFVPSEKKDANATHPGAPSPSVLQAFVVNLPPGTPAWKKDMAILFEKINRPHSYVAPTKIMNEGWATLMQEMIASHSPWNTTQYALDHMELLQGVAYPSLTNPYWLGRECWKRLRDRFNSRPEIKNLSQLEKDQKFIQYAHQEVIYGMSDYDFVRLALDEKWVNKYGLYLHRDAKPTEWDHSLPRQTEQDQVQKIVVSDDPRTVVDYVASRAADLSIRIPRIVIENFNAFGRGVVALKHESVHQIPLEKTSAAMALFVISRILEKPVSLETIFTVVSEDRPYYGPWYWPQEFETKIDSIPMRYEVESSGKIHVYLKNENQWIENAELATPLQQMIDAYREDISYSIHSELLDAQEKKFASVTTQLIDYLTQPNIHLLSHAPTAARAILEYAGMIRQRLAKSIQNAINGKSPLKTRGNKVRIRALPIIPEFGFDRKIQNVILKNLPMPQTSHFTQLQEKQGDIVGIDIGSGKPKRSKGDKFWGSSDKDGQGEGEEGEGEEGEGEEGEGTGKNPGKGGLDPSEIEIPLSLYAEYLQSEIELPNLRPKNGQSDMRDEVREGGEKRPYGDELWGRMTPKILALGDVSLRRQGKDPRKMDLRLRYQEGLKFIQPNDYIVVSRDPTPVPEINAVVGVWMDMTGSMSGEPIRMAKEFIFNLKALLSLKYKKVEFRFVGFDSAAHEFPESKFFKTFLGGGTNYSSGIKKINEILDTYNPSQWDKFAVGIGDAQDGDPSELVAQLYKKLNQTLQYSVFAQTLDAGNPEYVALMNQMAQNDKFFGYGVLRETPESPIEVLRKLFGKKTPK